MTFQISSSASWKVWRSSAARTSPGRASAAASSRGRPRCGWPLPGSLPSQLRAINDSVRCARLPEIVRQLDVDPA